MNTNRMNRNHARSRVEIFAGWLMLVAFATAALLLNTTTARAQQTGPLPAAAPSDQPPPPPRANLPKEIGGKPNISGTWTLNKDESDDPREAMREAGGNRGGSGGGPRVGMGGGGGGGWGHGGGGGGYGGHRGGQPNSRENPLDDLSTLTIAQTATSATVTSESGRPLAQYASSPAPQSGGTANSGSAGTQAGGGSTPASPSSSASSSGNSDPYGQGDAASTPAAQWKGSQLVAVTPGRRQGKTTRTYELSPDGKQLYVTTKVENPRFKNPVTYRLVYDPAPSGA